MTASPTSRTSAQAPFSDIQKLQNAVANISSLACEGLSEIASLAKVALAALETPQGARRVEDLANVFQVIWGKADDIQELVNGSAEEVGCNTTNETEQRRFAAYRQAMERGA